MKVFDLFSDREIPDGTQTANYRLLPQDSLVILGVASNNSPKFDQWHRQLKNISATGQYVFVDGGHDPVRLSDVDVAATLEFLEHQFPNTKAVLLSSNCAHWNNPLPKTVYFPFCFLNLYQPSNPGARKKRMGCLNRNNTPHRPWLMHNLLSKGLIDPNRDVYSIAFASPFDGVSYADVASFLGLPPDNPITEIIHSYPPYVATNYDEFINDYTTNHPAWHTGITIITETECGDWTMMTEKTCKAIMNKCCWTAYASETGYEVMRGLGFDPDFFDEHASYTDVSPIERICQKFDTEESAIDYYHSQQQRIEHNFFWFGDAQGSSNQIGPWANNWLPKLQHCLSNL